MTPWRLSVMAVVRMIKNCPSIHIYPGRSTGGCGFGRFLLLFFLILRMSPAGSFFVDALFGDRGQFLVPLLRRWTSLSYFYTTFIDGGAASPIRFSSGETLTFVVRLTGGAPDNLKSDLRLMQLE